MAGALRLKVAQLEAELDSLHKAITVLNQLAAELDIHTAMQNVRQVALELLDCERVTLFLIFERRMELRAMIDQNQILRIQFGEGIAGHVAQTGGSMNIADVYAHPMFNKEVDRATGFRTRSMLCMAVSDMTGKNVAVLQALNKKSGQPFIRADERNLKLFGCHLGNTLVKAKLHETAKREKERLQAIYTCFKSLNAAEEVGQMVGCATSALERHIIHAERVLFFLVDKPRGELWLHTSQSESMRLRVGPQGGVVGLCAESKKPQSWAEFDEPSKDSALGRLPAKLVPGRIKSVLVQPIHGTNQDRVLAVVLALNKREAEGTSDIFFEPFFTEADCDAMALFAYEVGDLLSERTLELSLLSALSVVGHDGAHPNLSEQSTEGNGRADGGDGTPPPLGTISGTSDEEDFIRSRLIQMYLPEYKKETSGSHGGVFSRSSFCAVTATANQMRASVDRKRTTGLSFAAVVDTGSQGTPKHSGPNSSRRSDMVLPTSRMSLAVRAAAARSFGCGVSGQLQTLEYRVLGVHDDYSAVSYPDATSNGGSPLDAPASPLGTFSDASCDLPPPANDLTRSRSSTQAEQPNFAMRVGGMMPSGLAPRYTQVVQHLVSPQRNGWSSTGGGGNYSAGLRRVSVQDRLMAPWRRSVLVQSMGGTLASSGGSGSFGVEGLPEVNMVEDDDRISETGIVTEEGEELDGLERRTGDLPEPFGDFSNVQEELRAAAEETLRLNVGDPQALRTHLSCTNLAQATSPRSPCFYSPNKVNSWTWDFTEFSLEELIKVAYDIFIMSGAMEEFQLQPKVLRNFLAAVASHYQAIPYHNFNHVCHVLQSTYLISIHTRVVNVLSPLERLALLISALCHDLDHDGRSNSFHVNSGSELSRIYNDQSVMENHHCAMTFAILSRTDCNVLAVLAPEEQRTARKIIISAILCTDMANHFSITQEFQKHGMQYEPDNESDRLLLVKIILHAADIGNAVRPFHVNHAMSRRVHREFESQSHEEMALGLPVTFAVDTSDHVMCARVELNFLDYVVTTLWERLVDVLPELSPQLSQLRINRARYRLIADSGKTAQQVLAEEEEEQRLQQQQQQQQHVNEEAASETTGGEVLGEGQDTVPSYPSAAAAMLLSSFTTQNGRFGSLTPVLEVESGSNGTQMVGAALEPERLMVGVSEWVRTASDTELAMETTVAVDKASDVEIGEGVVAAEERVEETEDAAKSLAEAAVAAEMVMEQQPTADADPAAAMEAEPLVDHTTVANEVVQQAVETEPVEGAATAGATEPAAEAEAETAAAGEVVALVELAAGLAAGAESAVEVKAVLAEAMMAGGAVILVEAVVEVEVAAEAAETEAEATAEAEPAAETAAPTVTAAATAGAKLAAEATTEAEPAVEAAVAKLTAAAVEAAVAVMAEPVTAMETQPMAQASRAVEAELVALAVAELSAVMSEPAAEVATVKEAEPAMVDAEPALETAIHAAVDMLEAAAIKPSPEVATVAEPVAQALAVVEAKTAAELATARKTVAAVRACAAAEPAAEPATGAAKEAEVVAAAKPVVGADSAVEAATMEAIVAGSVAEKVVARELVAAAEPTQTVEPVTAAVVKAEPAAVAARIAAMLAPAKLVLEAAVAPEPAAETDLAQAAELAVEASMAAAVLLEAERAAFVSAAAPTTTADMDLNFSIPEHVFLPQLRYPLPSGEEQCTAEDGLQAQVAKEGLREIG